MPCCWCSTRGSTPWAAACRRGRAAQSRCAGLWLCAGAGGRLGQAWGMLGSTPMGAWGWFDSDGACALPTTAHPKSASLLCCLQNLRRTVADLVEAGLSVAVCEEVRPLCCAVLCCAVHAAVVSWVGRGRRLVGLQFGGVAGRHAQGMALCLAWTSAHASTHLWLAQAPENYSYGLAHKKQKDRYVAQVVRCMRAVAPSFRAPIISFQAGCSVGPSCGALLQAC